MPEVYCDGVNVKTKPNWLKSNLHLGESFAEVSRIVEQNALHTICSSGKCPNKTECWSRRTATFMVSGDICTRACRFCATATGRPLPVDPCEPQRVARSVALMGLRHVVITSVTRDDLADGGAGHWAGVVEAVRAENPHTTIEILIPDFQGNTRLVDIVLAAAPDIVGHNLETVERLTPEVRSRAQYRVSLDVLKHIASRGFTAKSGLMLGLGERPDEVLAALDDLRGSGVESVTLGQYLQPTPEHMAVAEWITPSMFEIYKREALSRGFTRVQSGPLVRSSYMADGGTHSAEVGRPTADNAAEK